MQVIEFIKQHGYEKVNIIGTSGGALAAFNVALERGDMVHKLIADSFEGVQSLDSVTEYLAADRNVSKSKEEGRMFWEYCHGEDWEHIVDNDTAAVMKHNQQIKQFFHKDLSELSIPVLLTASLEDEFALEADMDFGKLYKTIASKIKNADVHIFETGSHPAMISNAEEFSVMAKKFFTDQKN